MRIHAKFEGSIPGDTWNTHLIVKFETRCAGDARANLATLMERSRVFKPVNVVMTKHGQEPWTSNNNEDGISYKSRPYVTDIEIRLGAINRFRAKQALVAVLGYWKTMMSELKIKRIIIKKEEGSWTT